LKVEVLQLVDWKPKDGHAITNGVLFFTFKLKNKSQIRDTTNMEWSCALNQRSHEKKPSRPKLMQCLYIISLAILLFSTAQAGKGKFRKSTNPQQNNKQPRTINAITGLAHPVYDAGVLPVAHAVIGSTTSVVVKGAKEDK
jgi:hypothetical protein